MQIFMTANLNIFIITGNLIILSAIVIKKSTDASFFSFSLLNLFQAQFFLYRLSNTFLAIIVIVLGLSNFLFN